MSQVTYVSDAEYRKLLAAQKNNMHVNNKSDMVTSCSKTCIDSHNKLKNLCDKQKDQLGVYEVEIVAYKEDVKKLEGQVVAYQKQQLSYEEKLKLQANDLYDKKLQIEKYKKTAEKALKEKEELKTRLESFDTSSKSLNTMHNSQLIAKDKAGFGHDGVKESKVSETITSVSKVETSKSKTSNDKMPKNETVRQAENPRKNNKSPRGNKRNWNNMMTQKLGDNFEFKNKACYVCGSFDHLHYTCKHKKKINDQKQVKRVWNNSRRVNHQNFGGFSHPNPKNNIVPQAVLTKSGLVTLNSARPINTVKPRKTMNDAMPTTYSYYKAYSSVKRPFNKKTVNYNRYFNKRVNTVKGTRVSSARPKAEVNTVKASASWVWKPKHEELDHVSKSDSASKTLTRYDYVDAYGRFKSVLAWDFKRH
ncbi:hypothetical protein Tco_0706377 [Tanacetum coccineum]|uniref:Ubiquitin hydrolase n=1 Tax=Tanacetum coccineum TaxID=301880 RepID=A0ABQ4Y864_9ASTR